VFAQRKTEEAHPVEHNGGFHLIWCRITDMSHLLRRPPTYALVVGLSCFALGAIAGLVLGSFQDALYAAARLQIIKRPEVHGFAGTELIDQARISEVADQSNAALRLLHSHMLGIGILIILATLAIVNLPLPARSKTVLCILASLGAVYPLGYAVMALLIPLVGVDALRRPVEMLFFIPFGAALIISFLGTLALLLVSWIMGWDKPQITRNGAVRTSPAE
jgi:hypothetical protein